MSSMSMVVMLPKFLFIQSVMITASFISNDDIHSRLFVVRHGAYRPFNWWTFPAILLRLAEPEEIWLFALVVKGLGGGGWGG
jgi:hypothetical protein